MVVSGVALAAWLDARRERVARHPQIEGSLEVAGLGASLRILRDRTGVPHIRAESAADAWFGLGFVHAQDRPGQMLMARRAALGTSAAHDGAGSLVADRWARTLGFARLAAAEEARLGAAEREVLTAYARGANAWIDRIRSGEVGAPAGVRVGPDLPPWTPVDSLAVLKPQSWTLGASLQESLVLEELIRRIGPAQSRSFFPGAVRVASTARPGRRTRVSLGEPALAPWIDPLRKAAGHAGRSVGSSAVLIRGSLVAGGSPLLAGDGHYPALAPAELHQADLR
ncbi:MAG: penicillin acylase family protein, partial [Miltoncostaeaceae bacterium]